MGKTETSHALFKSKRVERKESWKKRGEAETERKRAK